MKMSYSICRVLVLAAVATTVSVLVPGAASAQPACPASATSCGTQTVGGLGARKQAILAVGGNTLDIAIAMLETDDLSTNYPFGDNKSDDAANFGIAKQNWFMLRQACPQFSGQGTADFLNGAVLNNDLAADIACLNASQAFFGQDRFFGGHRNGESGLANPNTADIALYRDAVFFIQGQLDSDPANLTNDTRFFVAVPAI